MVCLMVLIYSLIRVKRIGEILYSFKIIGENKEISGEQFFQAQQTSIIPNN